MTMGGQEQQEQPPPEEKPPEEEPEVESDKSSISASQSASDALSINLPNNDDEEEEEDEQPPDDVVERLFREEMIDLDSIEKIQAKKQMSTAQKWMIVKQMRMLKKRENPPSTFLELIKKDDINSIKTLARRLKTCRISWVKEFIQNDGVRLLVEKLKNIPENS